MVKIKHYEIQNGTKSDKIPFHKFIKDEDELEELREYLEKVNGCWQENRTITGVERKRVKSILFTFDIL